MENLTYEIAHGGSLILLFMFILLLAKTAKDLFTPYQVDEELSEKDNVALAASMAGYFASITVVYIGALLGPSKDILQDLVSVGGYALLGILLLNLSHEINDRFILRGFSNVKEIIEDRNVGTGAVQFGSYMASGLIVAGAIHGEGGGVWSIVVFFLLGQIGLIAFTKVYNWLTPFDLHQEIEEDNIAAGVAFGGTLIAVGIILMKGASGNFVGWGENLSIFAMDAALVFILLPVVRFFFDKIIMPRTSLDHEIHHDRNLGAGLLEMIGAISFSVILLFVMR